MGDQQSITFVSVEHAGNSQQDVNDMANFFVPAYLEHIDTTLKSDSGVDINVLISYTVEQGNFNNPNVMFKLTYVTLDNVVDEVQPNASINLPLIDVMTFSEIDWFQTQLNYWKLVIQ